MMFVAVVVPSTVRPVSVPTEVSDELTTPDPRVSALSTSVPATL